MTRVSQTPFKRKPRRNNIGFGCLLACTAAIVAILSAEVVTRAYQSDWTLLPKLLYFQTAEWDCYEPDPDPQILFRQKPGDGKACADGRVTIDAFGARGAEHPLEKRPGVFRILVFGGSNVFGGLSQDADAWPAQLERRLNRDADPPVEVWNFGASSYVTSQMVRLAADLSPRVDPDLILLCPSNLNGRAFLAGYPVRPYFEKDPAMWAELFDRSHLPPAWIPRALKLFFIRHSSLARYLALRALATSGGNWCVASEHNAASFEATRDFVRTVPPTTRVAFFFFPGTVESWSEYIKYTELDVPWFRLESAGRSKEYDSFHPPPYVFAWYADEIAKWLRESDLLKPATPN